MRGRENRSLSRFFLVRGQWGARRGRRQRKGALIGHRTASSAPWEKKKGEKGQAAEHWRLSLSPFLPPLSLSPPPPPFAHLHSAQRGSSRLQSLAATTASAWAKGKWLILESLFTINSVVFLQVLLLHTAPCVTHHTALRLAPPAIGLRQTHKGPSARADGAHSDRRPRLMPQDVSRLQRPAALQAASSKEARPACPARATAAPG